MEEEEKVGGSEKRNGEEGKKKDEHFGFHKQFKLVLQIYPLLLFFLEGTHFPGTYGTGYLQYSVHLPADCNVFCFYFRGG